jgi:putative endonuclease
VYVLRSLNEPDRIYVGWTKDLRQRLKEQNGGMSPYTAGDRPWQIVLLSSAP